MPYRQTNSAYWWISYTDATGQRLRRSAGTTVFADAKALEQQLRAEHHVARRRAAPAPVGLDAILAEYLTREGRYTPRTRSIARALNAHFGTQSAASLATAHIYAYLDQRRAQRLQDSSIKRELTLLSAAITEYNRRHGTDYPNPVRSVKIKEPQGRVRWLTRDEAARLLAASAPALADYLTLALYTGMRTQELMGLEWSRVDLARRTVRLEAVHTKTERRRTIPLHPAALAALARCKDRHPDHPLVMGGVKNYRTAFATACRRAGIADFHPHDLRHTCASWLVMAGVPLYEVRDILGHASIQQTERYAHLAPENLANAIGKLDAL